MALPAQPSRVVRFGAFELDAAKGELRKAGVPLKIHPQPFRILLLLAEHPGRTVTREEIQHLLWRENTFVDFERGINFCINQIRVALGDDAEKPRYVETLPRRGYRFIAPVSPVAAAGVEQYVSKRFDSIVVLPLLNATGDPETEYLSDGISESVINLLSQFPNLRVIPRTSAFRCKGREADLKSAWTRSERTHSSHRQADSAW
jgi:DNA-binding winged helix-turn-helix (wHTH) protein